MTTKTLKETMKEALCQISQNKEEMKEIKMKNPQLYDLIIEVATEERRKANER